MAKGTGSRQAVIVAGALACGCSPDSPAPAPLRAPARPTIEDYAAIAPTAINDPSVEELLKQASAEPLDATRWTMLIRAVGEQTNLDDPTGHTPPTDGYRYVGAIVRVHAANDRIVTCTATALNNSVILTAAHCLFDHNRRIDTLEDAFYFVPEAIVYSAALKYHLVIPLGPDTFDNDARDLGLATLSTPLDNMASPGLAIGAQAAGTDIRKIGFGLWTDSSRPTQPLRKIGRRATAIMRVSSFLFGGLQFTLTPVDPAEGEVCNGDSGGPSFVSGSDGRLLIAGVTHGSKDPLATCHQGGVDTTVPGAGAVWITGWMSSHQVASGP